MAQVVPAVVGWGLKKIGAKLFLRTIGTALVSSLIARRQAKKGSSPTYSFGSLQNQTDSSLPIPLAYGKVKVAGNLVWQPNQADRSLSKLISFSDGPVKGFSNVKINDIPISQSIVFNLKYTGDAQCASYSVKNNIFYLQTFIHSGIFGNDYELVTSLSFVMTNKKSADLYNWVNSQPGWVAQNLQDVNLLDLKVKDTVNALPNCINKFIDVVTDYIPGECFYKAYLGDGEQVIDDIVPGTTQEEKAKVVGGMKYDACLALTAALSDKLNGDFNVTAILEGRLVRVYTSPTAYVTQWSDNPIWCVLDFMTCYNGIGVPFSEINIQSFIDAAAWCDGIVSNPDGTVQKRFTLNLILDEKKSRLDWLMEMLAVCHAYYVEQSGRIGVMIEKPEPVRQTFDISNISSFEIWADLGPDLLKVKYVDPGYDWTQVIAQAEAPQKLKTVDRVNQLVFAHSNNTIYQIDMKELELNGVTNFYQASRNAWFYLNQGISTPCWCSFVTDEGAINRTIGDIIQITDNVTEFKNKKWRIMQMSISQENEIQLVCREYNESLYSDALGSIAPTVNLTMLSNPFSPPPIVSNVKANEFGWMNKDGVHISNLNISWDEVDYQWFSEYIISLSDNNGASWVTLAPTYNAKCQALNVKTGSTYLVAVQIKNKNGLLSDKKISEPIKIVGKDIPPNDVIGLRIVKDSIDSTKLTLSWEANTDVDLNRYSIKVGTDWETGQVINDNVFATKYSYNAQSSGNLTFLIKAVDNSGNYSANAISKSINVTVEPAEIAGFSIAQVVTDRSQVNLFWLANQEKDISHYEIRLGTSWESGQIIVTQLKATQFTYKLPNEGNFNFMIKAVNQAGYYSVNPTILSQQFVIKPNSPANFKIIQNELDRTELLLSWDRNIETDIDSYDILINGVVIANIKETLYRYHVNSNSNFTFGVRAKVVSGYTSSESNITTQANITPADVTGFAVTQYINDHSRLKLTWDKPAYKDTSYFEIREGVNWDNSTLIATNITSLFYEVLINQEREYSFWIKAVNRGGVYSQFPANRKCTFDMNPATPTSLVAVQDQQNKAHLIISWEGTGELDLFEYELRQGFSWQDSSLVIKTKELRADFYPDKTGTYKFLLKAKNNGDFYSDEVFASIYCKVEPADVQNFLARQNGANAQLTWDKIDEPDVVGYEIREGNSFENGNLVMTGVTVTNYQVPVDQEKRYRYFIKAINQAGHYSQRAISSEVFIANLPPKNIILTFDEIVNHTGTHTNTEFGQSLFTFATLGGRFSDYQNVRFSDVGGKIVLKLAKNGTQFCSSGQYATQVYDIQQVLTCNISTDFVSSVLLRQGVTAGLEYRISQDNAKWSNWQVFMPVMQTFRYIQFRINMATADLTKTPEINTFRVHIDVPDTDKYGTANIPIGGTDVPYGWSYFTYPAVLPTAIGSGLRADLLSINKDKFRVRVVNSNNQDVGGQITWFSKGY